MTETVMTEAVETKSEQVRQIGPDRVTITDQEVTIEAKHAMADWEVRELNPIPVYFEDKKYYLVEKRKAAAPYAVRYLLYPWPEGQSTSARTFYAYDAEAVAEREGTLRSGRSDELVRACLMPFYPLLGFLWSGMQKRLMRFGFVPHAISGISIFTVFSLIFAEGVFAVILINASIRSGKLMLGGLIQAVVPWDHLQLGPVSIPVGLLDVLLLVALLADISVRYGRHFHEDQWSGGFLEWLVRRSPRED